jgi:hypothetical protein
MATITSAQTGNFSDTATWEGGVVPTVGDIAVAATGHVVAIDVDVTVDKVTQAGTGKFTLGNGRTLTAEVEANAGTFASGGTVEVTATSGNTAYIIGNVTGVSSTAVNVCGVNVTGAGTLDLTGNVTGSAGNASSEANGHAGVYTNVTCTIEISGNLLGGTGNNKRALQGGASADGTFTVDGNVTAGGGTTAYGAFTTGASATITITGNVTGGGGNTALGAHATGASATITITGDVTGGGGFSAWGAYTAGASATITITGDVTGGAGGSAFGAYTTGASATCTVTGDVTGGGGSGATGVNMSGASATCTVTGDVTGGGGSGAFGVYNSGASSFIDVTGTITAASSNHGVRSDATSVGVRLAGNLTDQQNGTVACWARIIRIASISPSGIIRYANDASFPTGGLVSRVSPDNVTGMPQTRDVRQNLLYGFNNELTGTLAVPNSGSVALGVPVDNTVGVAVLTLDEIWNYLASNATVPNSLGAILANIIPLLREDAIEQLITYTRNNTTLSISGSTNYRTFNVNTSNQLLPITSFGDEIL